MKNIQIDSIIKKITGRDYNLFKNDYLNNIESLKEKINKKSVLVIGGAGTIGSYFIKGSLINYGIFHFQSNKFYYLQILFQLLN